MNTIRFVYQKGERLFVLIKEIVHQIIQRPQLQYHIRNVGDKIMRDIGKLQRSRKRFQLFGYIVIRQCRYVRPGRSRCLTFHITAALKGGTNSEVPRPDGRRADDGA